LPLVTPQSVAPAPLFRIEPRQRRLEIRRTFPRRAVAGLVEQRRFRRNAADAFVRCLKRSQSSAAPAPNRARGAA